MTALTAFWAAETAPALLDVTKRTTNQPPMLYGFAHKVWLRDRRFVPTL